ncbi:hypothetical protein PIROE2DRAFT_37756, partial [Piromyces sp. E2]
KFFITLCQSINIPVFLEDPVTKLKICGFRQPEYIKKLSIIKDLFEKHYVNI